MKKIFYWIGVYVVIRIVDDILGNIPRFMHDAENAAKSVSKIRYILANPAEYEDDHPKKVKNKIGF